MMSRIRLLDLLVLAVYVTAQSFAAQASFLHGDDAQEIAFVNGLDSCWSVFGPDVFGLFRPVKNILFVAFSHLSSFGMPLCRSLAIAIGVVSFFPVRAFFRRFVGAFVASVAAGIWLLAPTLMSSVAWLSCVNIQLMCVFAALALCCHVDRRTGWAGFWMALACLSYEQAVAIFPILVAYDFFMAHERFRSRQGVRSYVGYALVLLAYMAARSLWGASTSLNGNLSGVSRLDLMFASAYFWVQHFFIWLWPFGNLAVFGSYTRGAVPQWMILLCWSLVAAWIASVFAFRKRLPVLAFSLTLAGIAFLPVSNVLGFGNGPYGDYYMGIPSLGIVLAWACVLEKCLTRNNVIVKTFFWLGIAFLGVRMLAVVESATWVRCWGDELLAYQANVRTFPNAFCVRGVLARVLCDAGRYEEALAECANAERLMSPEGGQDKKAGLHFIRAVGALRWANDPHLASQWLEKARAVCREEDLRLYHYYKGCIAEDFLKDVTEAKREFAAALPRAGVAWKVDDVSAADRYARLLALDGDYRTAIGLWEKAVKIQPDHETARINLQTALKLVAEKLP